MPWIWVDGNVRRAYEPLIVYNSRKATRLSREDAGSVKNAVDAAYPNYVWTVVQTKGLDSYLVMGTYPQSIVRT
jgi:hypothetical protein